MGLINSLELKIYFRCTQRRHGGSQTLNLVQGRHPESQACWKAKQWCVEKWYTNRLRWVRPRVRGVGCYAPADLPSTISTMWPSQRVRKPRMWHWRTSFNTSRITEFHNAEPVNVSCPSIWANGGVGAQEEIQDETITVLTVNVNSITCINLHSY